MGYWYVIKPARGGGVAWWCLLNRGGCAPWGLSCVVVVIAAAAERACMRRIQTSERMELEDDVVVVVGVEGDRGDGGPRRHCWLDRLKFS